MGARRSSWTVTPSLLAALVALCACAGGAEPGAPAARAPNERVIRLAFSRIEDADVALMGEQLRRFQDLHPGVRVELVAQVQTWHTTGIHDLWARVLALGDNSLDVLVIDDPWIAEFAFAGWIRPLDELAGWARERLHPAGLRGSFWRDRLYAVPLELSANALFYRRDLLEGAGLAPPRSLAELLEQAALLKRRHQLAHGLVLHAMYLHNDVYPFLWAAGGGLLDEQGQVVLDSAANVAVVDELAAAFASGEALPDRGTMSRWANPFSGAEYHSAVAAFGNGQAAFMVNWTRFFVDGTTPGSPLAGKLGMMPVPGPAGGGSTIGSWYLAVNASSRNPDLAVELVRFLSTEEAARERFVRLATFPPHRRFYEDEQVLGEWPILRTAGAVFAHARPRAPVPNEREVDEIVEERLRSVLFDERPAAEALAEAAAEVRRRIEAFPRQSLTFTETPAAPSGGAVARADVIVTVLSGLWLAAGGVLGLCWLIGRRRGGLFQRLAAKFASLGLVTVLLSLATGTAVALVVLVRNQDAAIREAQDIFRASIREHSRSMCRQIAMGAAMLGDASREAERISQKWSIAKDEDRRRVEAMYGQSLDVLTAEGSYSEDVLFLEVLALGDDSVVVSSDQTGFLTRKQVRSGEVEAVRPVDDREVADLARYGRRLTMRDVPAAVLPAHLEVMAPLVLDGRHAGAVRIGYSKERQDRRIAALRAGQERLLRSAVVLVIIMAAGLVLFSALLLVLAARTVAVPLVRLSELATRVEGGALDVACEVEGRDEVASLGRSLNLMVRGLREREHIKRTLGRVVGPSVTAAVLARTELGGEEREVTVLFSDVRGFTSIAEKMAPPEIVGLLNRYFDRMVDAVFKHGGMVDKFMGDGLMAVFGAPDELPDHPLMAVRAALAMREALDELNATFQAEGLASVQIGIGLNTGPAVVGLIGSSQRSEYTVIGDTVNLASRLEGATKQYDADIIVSAATWVRVADHVAGEPLGQVQVKGKEKSIEIHAVRGLRGILT